MWNIIIEVIGNVISHYIIRWMDKFSSKSDDV